MLATMANGSSETSSQNLPEGYDPNVRWVIPHRLDFMTFVGKDTLMVAHDIYIIFFNLKYNSETVYVANNEKAGDGVDAIAGHKSNLFAFAEKVKQGRIFVITYPSFNVLAELKGMDIKPIHIYLLQIVKNGELEENSFLVTIYDADKDVNRYKGLCMMECDLVAGFSGFPNYLISIWSWRTHQRLISIPTGVVRRNQIYMASNSHMLVCQCWGEGLTVWEVAQCYKRCLMMKRSKPEVTGWEVSEPPLVAVCWTGEGQLYAVDPAANLYSLLSDGIGMVTNLEWSDELKGTFKPCICSFFNGLLIYGPDKVLRSLKKCESKWKVVFSFVPHEEVLRLVSNAAGDAAAAWTAGGLMYRLAGDSEDRVQVTPMFYKQRHIVKIQLIAPDNDHLATMNTNGVLCIYEVLSGKLVLMKYIQGTDILFEASPVEPVLAVYGCAGHNYGLSLSLLEGRSLRPVARMCLTHQIVSRLVFSPTGRQMIAAAMSAGHIFILNLSEDHKLTLVRYTELGRGLADCFLMQVGEFMRAFSLVLFSDKYAIGERIICMNAETGKDNKFAGKMQGPYSRLLPLSARDHMLGLPHLSRHAHVLRLAADKGVTVSVKMGPVIDVGHDIKSFDGFFCDNALLTFGFDGHVILRQPDAPAEYDLKVCVSHRYEHGVDAAVIDNACSSIAHLAGNHSCALLALRKETRERSKDVLDDRLLNYSENTLHIIREDDKNYLDLQEEKKVREEAMDFKQQRGEVVRSFDSAQARLVDLLEENLCEPPLHQLSLAEFNLHLDHKKERNKQAEREREEIKLKTEARIRAQDKVTLWIKKQCWDSMLTPRVKLFAIFSHYQVENYAVLPSQRDTWLELQQVEALRTLEMDNDDQLFKPWEEVPPPKESVELSQTQIPAMSAASVQEARRSIQSQGSGGGDAGGSEGSEGGAGGQPHVLAGSGAHRYVPAPAYMLPQTRADSFLQMNWLQQIVKLNVQNMRLWFNRQFDELMAQKRREVGLVGERNARFRFIIEELNKLSDLRGSFHHLTIQIVDPEWKQEEQPEKLIKVDPDECSIEPYVSPSQVVVAPPEPRPKDDFKERALMDMMDGVLEKLWHEEIKKPIPMPQCMLDKEPEHFNEEDLRYVFEYEAKVAFRNEERDKYRKMLHAEYARLTQLLNEGILKFNQRVKEMWLLKLTVDSVIGQENLNLMRFRRTNLDRVENAEKIEEYRAQIARYEGEIEHLSLELQLIQEQSAEAQAAYDALQLKDRHMERTFKNHFADLSPIIVDQCYKFYKKRPKCPQRAAPTPAVLAELAAAVLAVLAAPRAPLHPDCADFYKGVEQLDLISNMPPVMDEGLWATMCRLRRAKIENEIRMRGMAQELAYAESAGGVWGRALAARRALLAAAAGRARARRDRAEQRTRNRTIQLVLPAGQVEITTTGHIEDFEDATLILREDIEKINEVILKVGEMKLRMMRKQMEFRKGILAKEWQHAQVKMKLAHMQEELYSYQRLKIPKELQLYLKNKELGYTEEQDYVRMEKEMEASKMSVSRVLAELVRRVEDLELKINAIEAQAQELEKLIANLNVKVSEKRLNDDPLEPIRIRRIFKKRMETLVMRSQLIREVQGNHTTIVLLQTELELLRLKTYPTLASFRTFI